MGARLYNTHQIVEDLLTEYPDTRNSDNLLYVKTCKHILPETAGMSFEGLLLNVENLGLPSYKSVERARRKIQKDNPDLKAIKAVEEGRYEQYKEYKEYALS